MQREFRARLNNDCLEAALKARKKYNFYIHGFDESQKRGEQDSKTTDLTERHYYRSGGGSIPAQKGSFDDPALGWLRIEDKSKNGVSELISAKPRSNITSLASSVERERTDPLRPTKPFYGSHRAKEIYVQSMLNFEHQRKQVGLGKAISRIKKEMIE